VPTGISPHSKALSKHTQPVFGSTSQLKHTAEPSKLAGLHANHPTVRSMLFLTKVKPRSDCFFSEVGLFFIFAYSLTSIEIH
jgi:hypothetical protein